ncbi:MAG: nitroreductase [Bacillota bacterium]|nr:MAG: nitroreductase [Bacillota bacterium]
MIEAIEKRVSVRTFQRKTLTKEDEKKVHQIIDEVKLLRGPFGNSIHLFFYETPIINDTQSQIGTYGFVKNYKAFIAGKVTNSFEGLIDFGYLFEHVILKLTEHDLGTVWLGGTFNREIFDPMKAYNEVIPAITPVGYPNSKKSLRETIIRRASRGDQRKPFETLFFEHDFNHPLSINHPLAKYLKLIQIGPSASNKQPWRCIIENDTIHLYLERTPQYGKSLPYDIQALDIGIALCHLLVSLQEDQVPYQLIYHLDIDPENDIIKVISVKINKKD